MEQIPSCGADSLLKLHGYYWTQSLITIFKTAHLIYLNSANLLTAYNKSNSFTSNNVNFRNKVKSVY